MTLASLHVVFSSPLWGQLSNIFRWNIFMSSEELVDHFPADQEASVSVTTGQPKKGASPVG